MAIFLIRHGETAANAARIVQTADTPLSPRGAAQAARLAQRLAGLNIGGILSSDHPRAAMTAAPVRESTGAPSALDPDLRERNYGALRGRPYSEVGDIFAPDLAPPDGETWAEFHDRVDRVWERVVILATRTPGNLAVVTHGLVCYSLALHHLRLPHGVAPPMRWGNTSLTIVDPVAPWVVQLLNCTAHLDADTADDLAGVAGL